MEQLEAGTGTIDMFAYFVTIGCHVCSNGYAHRAKLEKSVGVYIQYCESIADNYDVTLPNVPCEKLGTIQILQGYIEEEKTLECVECKSVIPNCVVCKDDKTCDICYPSYK